MKEELNERFDLKETHNQIQVKRNDSLNDFVAQKYQFLRPSQRHDSTCSEKGIFDLRFQQIKDTVITKCFCQILCSFLCFRIHNKVENMPSTEQDFIKLEQQLPIQKPIFEPSNEQIKYTWIGHSTAVISIGKKANILIDPVFSERSSPVTFAGPKRFRNPACQIEDLPKIDLVFVSHDHHDHLNPSSLQKIENLHQPYFIAGLQSADVFPQNCKMVQMDWMDEKVLKINKQNFKLTFVPVCHWSRRGLTDQGKRLWGGLILETPNNKRIFYPGDTGYCGVFKQIGDKYGPFDLCILPIGAYQPRDLLKAQHFNPDDSVKVHLQLKSKKSVGVHWGTFPLGMEHYLAARIDLKKAKQKYGIPDDEFITVNHGGSFTVNDRKI